MTKPIKLCDRCKKTERPKTLYQGERRFWLICDECTKELSRLFNVEQHVEHEPQDEAA